MMYEKPTSWLGMTYKHDLERNFTQFIWEDNFPVLYVAWDVGQPAVPTNELGCVTVSKSGLWSVEVQGHLCDFCKYGIFQTSESSSL